MNARHRFLALVAAVGALMLAGCTTVPQGSVEISVTGLPGGTVVSVNVTGPDGFASATDAPGTLTGLAPGAYTVEAVEADVPNAGYTGTETFVAEAVEFEVVANQTAAVGLQFVHVGARVEDPSGDAVGLDGFLTYDLLSVTTSVDGEDLLIELGLTNDETDLSQLVAVFDLDVDQDAATSGQESNVDHYCEPAPGSLGIEYELEYGASTGAELTDVATDTETALSDPAIDGTTLTFTVPLAAIGGSARINVGAVVGNSEVPTDCSQGGLPVPLGNAEISVSGLPVGAAANVTVNGPNGYSSTVEAPVTLSDLAPGAYTVEPADAELANASYIGTESFASEPVGFDVVAFATTAVIVPFEYTGATVEDAIGDTTDYVGNDYHYDIASVTTALDGDDLLIVLTLEESQTDMTELITLFDLDTDQDSTTSGGTANIDSFCDPSPGSVGVEYQISYGFGPATLVEAGTANSTALDAPEFVGSTATFTVPQAAIDGAERINVGLIIGNLSGPTDCTQGTATL